MMKKGMYAQSIITLMGTVVFLKKLNILPVLIKCRSGIPISVIALQGLNFTIATEYNLLTQELFTKVAKYR